MRPGLPGRPLRTPVLQSPPMAGKRAHGEGTVYRSTSGLWRGRVMVNGKMRWVSAKTKAECAAKLHKAAQEARAGQAQPDSQVTVAQYMAGWLEGARARLRPRTWAAYEGQVRLHVVPGVGWLRLADLSPAHVTAMLARLHASGAAPAMVAKTRAVLRSALTSAVRDGMLTRNAAALAQAPRAAPPPARWLDTDQAKRFLEAALGDPVGDMLAIVLMLGLRCGEALGLKWADLDTARGHLEIRRTIFRKGGTWHESPPKSRQSRRTLPLPPQALTILERQRLRQDACRQIPGWHEADFIWTNEEGAPRGHTWVTKGLRRILQSAELPQIRLHDLRHSAASILLEQGVPARVVADLLGHSQVSLTLGTYSHVTARLVEGATAALGALAEPRSAPIVAAIVAGRGEREEEGDPTIQAQ